MSEDRDRTQDERLTELETQLARSVVFEKIIACCLSVLALPVIGGAIGTWHLGQVTAESNQRLSVAFEQLAKEVKDLSINGSRRINDRIDVNASRISDNAHDIEGLDNRVRRLEAGRGGNVSTNTNIVNVSPDSPLLQKPLLTTSELAEIEGVNEDTVRRRGDRGDYQKVDFNKWQNPYVHESGMDRASNVPAAGVE